MILLKRPAKMRIDYELIESLVPDNAKVLDLVNKGLAAIIKDGTLNKLKAKWLQ